MNGARKARVYARSLFQAARDADSLEETGADLKAFTDAMRRSGDLTVILFNPRIDSRAKKKAVAEIAAGGDRLFLNCLNLMIDKRVVAVIFDLERHYRALLKQEQGIVEIEVTSAAPLDEDSRSRIQKSFQAATGKRVELAERVSGEIIGGLVVHVGNTIIDGSLRGRLKQLRRQMRRVAVAGPGESEGDYEAAS